MGRHRKPPPVFRLEVECVPASAEDAKYAISALALMYRHVMLRNTRVVSSFRRAEALPAAHRP